jgi:lipopolysaccharide/colanic/teichoic acid biosynthesis glycosyltransferase
MIRLPSSWYISAKKWLDQVLALVLLILAGPIILLCMVLVKLTSPGPALYSQTRLGRHGQPFLIYKIRSMTYQCERHSGARWSTPGDSRVTPLGRFLRKAHLDELPQLWNILRGEMSLVGPRPERPEFVPQLEQAIPHYRARLLVNPGLTGLAQVNLPPDSDLSSVRRKLSCDLLYLKHISLWLDLRLILSTALTLCGIPFRVSCRVLRIPGEPVPVCEPGVLVA